MDGALVGAGSHDLIVSYGALMQVLGHMIWLLLHVWEATQ